MPDTPASPRDAEPSHRLTPNTSRRQSPANVSDPLAMIVIFVLLIITLAVGTGIGAVLGHLFAGMCEV